MDKEKRQRKLPTYPGDDMIITNQSEESAISCKILKAQSIKQCFVHSTDHITQHMGATRRIFPSCIVSVCKVVLTVRLRIVCTFKPHAPFIPFNTLFYDWRKEDFILYFHTNITWIVSYCLPACAFILIIVGWAFLWVIYITLLDCLLVFLGSSYNVYISIPETICWCY